MIARREAGTGQGTRLWAMLLAVLFSIKCILVFALQPTFVLSAYSGLVYFGLLLLATVFATQNALRRIQGCRWFWVFLAGGLALWAFDQSIYIYYGIGLRQEVPDNSVADPALFLHIVPFMAAAAMQPHLERRAQSPSRASLNFLLLLFFWVFLYAYALFPYQFLFADDKIYGPRFTHFYALENLALLVALGVLILRAQRPWRSIYAHLFGASVLYGVSSTLANIAIDAGREYNGSLVSLAQMASVCWFVWTPLRARNLLPAQSRPLESETWQSEFLSLTAKLAVIAIPLIGMWELFYGREPSGLSRFRLAVVLLSVIILALVVYSKDYLARRELVLDWRASKLHQQQSQAALRDREEKFQQMADNIQEVFWMIDATTRQALYVNSAFERITGRTVRSLMDDPLSYWEIIHPDDRARVQVRLDQARRSGVFDEQLRIVRPDGETRWLAARGFAVRDEQGAIYRLAGVAQDITERKRMEEVAQQTAGEAAARAEELEAILDAVPGLAIIARDPTCRVMTGSRATYRILQLPYGANLSMSAPEGIRPSNFHIVRDGVELPADELPVQKAARTGQAVQECEFNIAFNDGTALDFLGNAAPFWGADDKVRGAVGVFVDVTEHKQAEQRLREYEKALEGLEEMIVVVDRTYRFVLANRAYLSYRGIEREEVVGHLIPEIVKDGVFETVAREKLDECFQGKIVTYELKYRYPRRGERDLLISYFPIEGPHGIDRVVSVMQDVTERKRAEKALLRLAAIVESSDDAIVSKDPNGVITSWNAAAQRIFGYSEAEAVGRPITIVIPPELLNEEAQILRRLRAGERIEQFETIRVTKQGKRVDVSLTISPMKDAGGRMVGASKIARDITEVKRTEEALREAQAEVARVMRMAAMGELTASIAHEINQPLGAVVADASAAAHWLAQHPPNLGEAREAMARTIAEANRASNVIARIRALLRKSPPQAEPFDLNATIRESLAMIEHERQRAGVSVALDLPTDIPAALGDRVQVQQVVLNLIMNAIEAMVPVQERRRTLRIRTALHGEGVAVEVEDSGTGIKAEEQERIFEPFFTTKPHGIGMGLAIGRSIIEAHRGHLWVTPGADHGAIFHFTLPTEDVSS